MMAAGAMLKSLYPKHFHVTRVAHLSDSCAMQVKSHLEDVDPLNAKVKSATIKNKTRKLISLLSVARLSVLYRMGKLVKCCLILCKEFA